MMYSICGVDHTIASFKNGTISTKAGSKVGEAATRKDVGQINHGSPSLCKVYDRSLRS